MRLVHSLREGVAALHIARAESFLKPVHTLLRTAMSKSFAIYGSACHALQPVIAHRRRRIQALAHFIGIEQLSLIGRVSPDAGQAVRLQFQTHGKLVCRSRVLLLRGVNFLLDSNQFLYVMPELMGKNVGLRKFSGCPEALPQFVIESEINVYLLIS